MRIEIERNGAALVAAVPFAGELEALAGEISPLLILGIFWRGSNFDFFTTEKPKPTLALIPLIDAMDRVGLD